MIVLFLILMAAAGVAALGVLFFVPTGSALVLLAITPFEGLPSYYLGFMGNLLTLVPILIFLARQPPGLWLGIFIGTRIQLAALAFLLSMLISHGLSLELVGPLSATLSYSRKIVLFLLLGLFGSAFSSDRWVGPCMKTIVASTAAFTLVSVLDFYFGIRLFPGTIEAATAAGAAGVEVETANIGNLRFRGLGLPINRTANWLMLPTFLAAGWWMAKGSFSRRGVALGMFVLLLGGLLGTIGRAAILGFALGSMGLMRTVIRRFGIWGIGAGAVLTIAGLYSLTLLVTNVGDLVTYRFGDDSEGQSSRLDIWAAALTWFVQSPLIGIGADIVQVKSSLGVSSHSLYVKILTESGLLGFIPLMAMIGLTLRSLTLRVADAAPSLEYWRPFVLAAFVALLVQNVFNAYPWERYFWVCFAYGAAVERAWLMQLRTRRAAVSPPGIDPLAGPHLRSATSPATVI